MVGPLWPAANRRPSYRMAAPFSSRSRGGLCRSVLPFARGLAAAVAWGRVGARRVSGGGGVCLSVLPFAGGLAAAVAWERIDLAEFRVGGDDAPLDELLAARVLEDETAPPAGPRARGGACAAR